MLFQTIKMPGSVDSHKCLMEVRVDRFDGGILMTVIKLVCMVARVLLGPPSIKVVSKLHCNLFFVFYTVNRNFIYINVVIMISLHIFFFGSSNRFKFNTIRIYF